MPARTKTRTRVNKHDVKKLFGADFKEPTPADYAAAKYVPVDKVLEGLEDSTTTKSQPREELLGQMKLQVKQMKRQLSQLEKHLLKL